LKILQPKVELIAITPNAQKVIEEAGRTCYMSFHRMQEGSDEKLIKSLIRAGHDSVLEHAYATFRISNVSRALTHQLVRHRLNSFSQQSQRYVDEKGAEFIVPPSIQADEVALVLYTDIIENALLAAYETLRSRGIPKEDARYLLPNAVCSEIVVSGNFRQWRHVIEVRGGKGAQWEIRDVAIKILEALREEAPAVFGDFEIDEEAGTVIATRYRES
jgi:thymidylate synthase (FAD)